MTINKEKLREARKQMMVQMEQKLQEMHTKEDDSLFYYHSSENLNPRILKTRYARISAASVER